ncbi:uncharacterized protein [Gossypium hirsutum]|uniref:Tf2-1-like SH3-like domain-containing protein n=1 Tax=Gossypium hirsutum TaxID=3635 RepID=A0A1U8LTA3_GOSHI|nr:uncharacterized protein LOC107930638 [Gossypium hirsutum]
MTDLKAMFAHLTLFDDRSLLAELQVKPIENGNTVDFGLNCEGYSVPKDTDLRVIQDQLKAALDKQKSYADLKHKDIKYAMGDFVFLKVSSWKKVLRFGRKGKLSPRFIRPDRILRRVRPIAYQLQLPPELERIHDVFHVSMLRRYCSNPMHVVPIEEIEIRPNVTFEEEPIQILDREVKVLRRKSIPLVKVLWRNHSSEVATSEPEEAIRQQYPHLF